MRVVDQRNRKEKRKLRTRRGIFGTKTKPRLSVFRSNKYIYGQLVEDDSGKTLVGVQAEVKKLHSGKSKGDAAAETGKLLAKKAKEKGITEVIFDRGSSKYHGRVKRFAEGARKGGLKF